MTQEHTNTDILETEHAAYRRGCLLKGIADAGANGTVVHESKAEMAEALRVEGLVETFDAGRRSGERWRATEPGAKAAEDWSRKTIFESMRFGSATPPGLPEKSTLRVAVLIDGKIAADTALEHHADEDTTLRTLADLTVHVGADAVFQLFGKKAADRWHGYVFASGPKHPTKPEPVLDVFLGMLDGSAKPGAWSWHMTRLSERVRLVRVESPAEVHEMAPSSAFHQIVRAIAYSEREPVRVLAPVFAGLGVPFRAGDGSDAPGLAYGAAEAEEAVLRAAVPYLSAQEAREAAAERLAVLGERLATKPAGPIDDKEPKRAKDLAAALDLHPVRAQRLVEALRSSPDRVLLLADALEARAEGPGGGRHAITITPERPTLEAIRRKWRRNKDVDEAFLKGQFDHQLREWERLYGRSSPARSNNLARRAVAAMNWPWDWEARGAHERFREKVKAESAEEAFRNAVRPWPERGWRGVEVGSSRFGKLTKRFNPDDKPWRKSATPLDLYRLLYLLRPAAVDFDDMYKCGLFGIVSPCHRFAATFSLFKYELAAYYSVRKDLAVTTRDQGPIAIMSGAPGADNGVATMHPDAKRWFRMIFLALHRPWDVYPGNNFRV